MTQATADKLKEIKQSFRLMMNGPTAQSMREKGVSYKLNWGVPVTALRQSAARYGKDYDLATALWKEDIRECKLMAVFIMPIERMSSELAQLWMEQTTTQEVAETAALYLYSRTDDAPALAFRWIASSGVLWQLAGYDMLGRLFMNGFHPVTRSINEFLDQAVTALQSRQAGLQHAAYNAVVRFVDLGSGYEKLARSALRSANLDIL